MEKIRYNQFSEVRELLVNASKTKAKIQMLEDQVSDEVALARQKLVSTYKIYAGKIFYVVFDSYTATYYKVHNGKVTEIFLSWYGITPHAKWLLLLSLPSGIEELVKQLSAIEETPPIYSSIVMRDAGDTVDVCTWVSEMIMDGVIPLQVDEVHFNRACDAAYKLFLES
jgi:hypothetical protein